MLTAQEQQTLRNLPPEDQRRAVELSQKIRHTRQVEAARQSFMAFAKMMWPGFIEGRHHSIMADAFGVPELGYLSNFQLLRHHVSANSGIKRNFSFLHHRPSEEHHAEESCQFQTMTYPLGPDSHLYRPDVDAWVTALAITYGAVYRERTVIDDLVLEEDLVDYLLRATDDHRAAKSRFGVELSPGRGRPASLSADSCHGLGKGRVSQFGRGPGVVGDEAM